MTKINERFTEHLRCIASECFRQTKPPNKNFDQKKPWFNWRTRTAKRELRKATNAVSNSLSSDMLRTNFYKVKAGYKRIISKAKNNFFERMNTDIENGKILNWQSFKKLKGKKSEKLNFDSYDMNKFEHFFTDLYSDKHKTVSDERKYTLLNEADSMNSCSTHTLSKNLNDPIAIEEVNSAIKSLKSGKASSIDMISNEILKSLNNNHRDLLKNIFNSCFTNGIYPWNESIISRFTRKETELTPITIEQWQLVVLY